jgi:hypothetical protein
MWFLARPPVLPPRPQPVECEHVWSNWSKPTKDTVTTHWGAGYSGAGSSTRSAIAQNRHCLRCNIYETRLA